MIESCRCACSATKLASNSAIGMLRAQVRSCFVPVANVSSAASSHRASIAEHITASARRYDGLQPSKPR